MIIYKATNIKNNKVYIGQTTNTLEYRRNQHIREMMCSKKKNTYFHNALAKHGPESFVFDVIDQASTIEDLNAKEQEWIRYYDSTNRDSGYNLDSGGNNNQKSKSTKLKIGKSTEERWGKPEIARAMLVGLRKGNESWAKKCADRRVSCVCKGCGEISILPKHIAERYKYCSNGCRVKSGNAAETALRASRVAATLAHERNIKNKELVADRIIDWCMWNQDKVMCCPKNKIRSRLKELFETIRVEFGIKDVRTLYICFGVKNLKGFLSFLQSKIDSENIC